MPPPKSPLVADRYRLLEPLGQGGMGRVWKARDEVLHRDVAIKELVPPPGLTDEERREMRERSLREARAIARLNHINVVRVFDVLRTDADPWIVMEYVPSRSLQDVLANDGPVTPARAAEIGLGVLGALKAAHRSGVMHRDVKPGNVLLGDDGRVVLTDFGLATVPGDPNVTRTGLVLGSPAYIAPERAKDGTAGPEGDLWSLGATLYAAVEGQSPYARPSAIATLAALATEPPPPAKRAGSMRPVLNGLLRKDPAARITAGEAERLLRRAAGKRSRVGRPMLDGVRRPSPFGPRDPHEAAVPASRASVDAPVAAPVSPPPAAVAPPPEQTRPESMPDEMAATKVVNASRVPAGSSALVGKRFSPVGDEKGASPTPKRRAWLVGAAAALLVLAIVVILSLTSAGPEGERSRQSGAISPTAAPSSNPAPATAAETTPSGAPPTSATPAKPTSTPGLVLPAGWHMYRDRTGFSVAVPANWSVSREGTRVYFREPNGNRLLLIDQTDQPKPDPVKDWQEQESRRRDSYPDYQRVRIEAVDYFLKAADWEFTYTAGSGTRLHVINRGVVIGPEQAYGIYWSTPDSVWEQNLDQFGLIIRSFQPKP